MYRESWTTELDGAVKALGKTQFLTILKKDQRTAVHLLPVAETNHTVDVATTVINENQLHVDTIDVTTEVEHHPYTEESATPILQRHIDQVDINSPPQTVSIAPPYEFETIGRRRRQQVQTTDQHTSTSLLTPTTASLCDPIDQFMREALSLRAGSKRARRTPSRLVPH